MSASIGAARRRAALFVGAACNGLRRRLLTARRGPTTRCPRDADLARRRRTPVAACRLGCASRCCTSSSSAACCSRSITSSPAGPTIRARSSSTPRSTTRPGRCSRQRAAASPTTRSCTRCAGSGSTTRCSTARAWRCRSTRATPPIRERVIFKALSVVDAERQAAAVRRQGAARVVRAQPRQVRRAGALRLPGSRARPATPPKPARARVRGGAERRHAGRRQGRPARVQGPAARQPRPELRAGVRQGARGVAAGRVARPARPAKAGA